MKQSLWQKHIAITQEHGSWVFLFSPLLIGLFAGARWTAASGWLIVAALAVFLFRQPLTVIVKVWSKRRGPQDLAPACFWSAFYGLLALIGLAGLWWEGQAQLAILALPGLPVFVWYLYLVARRAERRQLGVEIVASGVLALAAPAAYWIGRGRRIRWAGGSGRWPGSNRPLPSSMPACVWSSARGRRCHPCASACVWPLAPWPIPGSTWWP
ncbi:YwiC-like family protein [Candidatus Amarolinea dominans]|uniref:YwiC-like family protein n=1 Tax=Candidatus Amarolinea dominans TaxID=3140696 RepID=UPI00313631F8|nr:YwiC-like family protein [Anaerolineae bacterium]